MKQRIILCILCLIISSAYHASAENTSLDSLKEQWHDMTESGDYDGVIQSAGSAYRNASLKKEWSTALYAAIMTAQSMYAMNMPDSMYKYLNTASAITQKYRGAISEYEYSYAAGVINNTLGMYHVDGDMNFYKAIRYFSEGMRITENIAPACYYAIEGNLAMLYYLRSDPKGLMYSEDILSYGIENNHDYYTFVGSYTSAYFHHLKNDDSHALLLIEQAVALVDDFYDKAGVYTLYGDILYHLGQTDKAAEYMKEAFNYLDSQNACSYTETYLNYADYLCDNHLWHEAAGILNDAVNNDIPAGENYLYRYKLYFKLSDVYHALGDDARSLQYYKAYHTCYDSIFKLEREYSLNELMISYQTERHKRIIQEKETELIQSRHKNTIYGASAIVILIIAFTTGLLYIRKTRMYRLIAKSYYEGREHIAEPKKTDRQDSSLFDTIQKLMSEDKLYREKNISLEELASRLNTNRTYISETINNSTGMNFRSYINSLRIKEATAILSSKENDTPLKVLSEDLGFNDLSTFYRSFQKIVGMPPSRFRQEIINLSQSAS